MKKLDWICWGCLLALSAFGIAADNMGIVTNGGFDSDLVGWQAEDAFWNGEDRQGQPDSGSAHLINPHISAGAAVSQCTPVTPGEAYEFRQSFRYVSADPQPWDQMLFRLIWYADAECLGDPQGNFVNYGVGPLDGEWHDVAVQVRAPASAQRVRILAIITPPGGTGPREALVDDVRLVGQGLIFADGFEFGDTSAWLTGN